MRDWRRRFGAGGAVPTRRELIEEAAYADAEAEGAFAPTREENVLVAIYDLLGALALTRGVELDAAEARLQDWEALRPRRRRYGSEAELREREDAETRRAFASLIAQAKARGGGMNHEAKTN